MELVLESCEAPKKVEATDVFGKKFKPKKYATLARVAGDAAWALDSIEKLHVRTRGGTIAKVEFNGKITAHTQRWDGNAIVALAMAKTGMGTIIEVSLDTGAVEREVPLAVSLSNPPFMASLRTGYITGQHNMRFAYTLDGTKVDDPANLLGQKELRGLATIPGGEGVAIAFPEGIEVIAIDGKELKVIAKLAGSDFGLTNQDGKLYVVSSTKTPPMIWHLGRLA
jgi:hypothetical protein